MNIYQKYGITAALVLGMVSFATAQTTTDQTTDQSNQDQSVSNQVNLNSGVPADAFQPHPAPMVLEVDAAGNALIRGTVLSVGTDSLTIGGWGGTWTVRTTVNGTVIPQSPAGTGAYSAISVGDFVGAKGTLASDQAFTINASLVRDWTTNPFIGTGSVQTSAGSAGSVDQQSTTPTDTSLTPTNSTGGTIVY